MIVLAVDGRPLHGNMTGVGKYLYHLLVLLDKNIENVQFVFFTNRKIDNAIDLKNFEIVEDASFFSRCKPMIWFILFSHLIINKRKFDFFLAGGTFIPFFLKKSKMITIAYDLNHILASETMSKLHNFTHWLFYKRAILKADAIIAISKGTSNKLLKYYKRKADFIIYPFVSEIYQVINKALVSKILLDFGIKFPYILSVGTLEPRKNIDKLIKSFLLLKDNGKLPNHKLVLVGSSGWKSSQMQEIINSNKEKIFPLGYIPDNELPIIYNGASLFVFPSKYEGFGIPPREAMYCGIQTIVSNIEELQEATMQSAIYIEPNDVSALANAIDNAMEHPKRVNNFERNPEIKSQLRELICYLK